MSLQALKLGAGGFVNGISIANDGTRAIRTDVGGAYVGSGSALWTQVLKASHLPAGDPAVRLKSGTGVYEIRVAPSDSSRMYMYFSPNDGSVDGYMYVSRNAGATWQATGFSSVPAHPNNQGREGAGPYMAVDPQNPDILIVGTEGSGAFITTNAGGLFTSISGVNGVGTATSTNGHAFAYDPNSSVSGGAKQGIYCATYGTGVFHSTNGGSTWARLNSTGEPTTYWHIVCAPDGTLWVIDASLVLHKYSGGAWSLPTTPFTPNAIAVNPLNSSEIVIMESASITLGYSSNGSTFSSLTVAGSATDIPWLTASGSSATTLWPNHQSVGALLFDPSQASATPGNSVLYMAEGTGVWKCPVTGSGTQTFTSISAGIEELVIDAIVKPPGGYPLVACFDRPVFTVTDSTRYPSTFGPNFTNIIEGYNIDYGRFSDPSTAVILAQNGPNHQHSYSTNYGVSWAPIPGLSDIVDLYDGVGPGGGVGGCVAVSTASNWVYALSDNAAGKAGIWYTTNGGTNWAKGTCAAHAFGSGTFLDGWGRHPDLKRIIVAADPLTANRFFAYNHGESGGSTAGVYLSTDSGATWTLQKSGVFDSANGVQTTFFNATLRAAPGKAGHLYFTSGDVLDSTVVFNVSTDGAGVTWTALSGVTNVYAFGFGKAKPGSSGYPTIYLYGYVGGTTSDKLGIWQGYNLDTTPVWTQLTTQYVDDRLDWPVSIEGDPDNFGTFYVGFTGTGALLFTSDPTGPALHRLKIHHH